MKLNSCNRPEQMSVFVSYPKVDSNQAQSLLDTMQEANLLITDSIEVAECFVAIVTDHYPFSTVLQEQALRAVTRYKGQQEPKLYIYNPGRKELPQGFQQLNETAEKLPVEPKEVIVKIKAEIKGKE
jgi:hypothetical protein